MHEETTSKTPARAALRELRAAIAMPIVAVLLVAGLFIAATLGAAFAIAGAAVLLVVLVIAAVSEARAR